MSKIITSTDLQHHDLSTRTGRVMWAYACGLAAEAAPPSRHWATVSQQALQSFRDEGLCPLPGTDISSALTDARLWLRDRVGRDEGF